MDYVIGIDGGGTSTHLKALQCNNNTLLGHAYGGASNRAALPLLSVRENLAALLYDFYANHPELERYRCVAVCLGTAGAGSRTVCLELEKLLLDLLPQSHVFITNDAITALHGGTLDGIGTIIISGTGSICLSQGPNGEQWRTGGWGHVIGDEGSGYGVAVEMLAAVLRAYDRRGPKTVMTEYLLHHFGYTDPMQLMDFLHLEGKVKADIAELAIYCAKAYDEGDRVAQLIVERQAAALAEMVVVASEQVHTKQVIVPCVYSGGHIINFDGLREKLAARLEMTTPHILLQPCVEDAAYGAALIAIKQQYL